eukprot:1170841-Amphidinium_carterae.1
MACSPALFSLVAQLPLRIALNLERSYATPDFGQLHSAVPTSMPVSLAFSEIPDIPEIPQTTP